MKRIVNLKVLLPAAAAIAFILFACSSQVPSDEPIPSGPNGQISSSSISSGGDSGVSSSQPEQGNSSSQGGEVTSSSSGQNVSSSSVASGQASSSSSVNLSSSGTQNVSSSSRAGGSSSGTQNASSSSRAGGSSSGTSSSSGTQNASSSSARSSSSIQQVDPKPNPKADFKETVGSASFDMIYVPGGTFTIGCEKSSGCPSDTKAVSGVTVSSYYISKTEVTNALWKAVMGSEVPPPNYAQNTGSATHMDWFQAIEFTCKLSQLTGRKYHMTTEAEWEYAAKNYKDKLERVGSGEEWAYNTWNSTHSGGKDPIGPKPDIGVDGKPVLTTQKTRRDAQGTADNITGRLIRSIDGIGPALRLAVSDEMAYPPDMVPACEIHAPVLGNEPVNSYRDPRWVTGDNSSWQPGAGTTIGSLNLKVWADGTAQFGNTNGQWFTSNNITFVFVPNSGSVIRLAYIFLSETEGSLIPVSANMMGTGGYIGKIAKKASTNTKPSVTLESSAEALARKQSNFDTDYKMVNMVNIPASAQKQDPRIMDEDTPNAAKKGWFQNNTQAGGVHHYRKDVDPDEFRFTVNNPGNQQTILANGTWFTVNNTFLRVTHKNGYVAEYLYSVTPDGTFFHNSFMGYERSDFRMFKKETNASWPQTTCGDLCSKEIEKGLGQSMYANQGAKGKSTFVPAPCPASGCN